MQESLENKLTEEIELSTSSNEQIATSNNDAAQELLSDVDNQKSDEDSKSIDTEKKQKKAKKPLIKKFDLYIIKKFIGTFFFIILMLLLVIVMFDINEKLDAMLLAPLSETVFKYFMNFLPYFINQFAPMFVFITVIFFTSKLADRCEITAILSSGISFNRLAVPYIVSATFIAIGTLVLSLYIIPPANVKRIEYTNQWVNNKRVDYGDNVQLQMRPGVMFHMERFDNTTKHGYHISIEEFKDNVLISRITAESAVYDTLGRWKLSDYNHRKFDGIKETMKSGPTMDTLLNFAPKDFLISKNDQETLTSPELKRYIDEQKERGVANLQQFEIEYEKRFAMTAAAFILTMIGFSLSSRKVRGGTGVNIMIGIVLSFSYILFMQVTQTFAQNGYTSSRVAMWIPNILFSMIAVVLYKKASR